MMDEKFFSQSPKEWPLISSMRDVIFLWVCVCFFHGCVLILKSLSASKKVGSFSLSPLRMNWFQGAIMLFLFLFIPLFTQTLGVLFLKKIPNSIDKTLGLMVLSELSLVAFISWILKNSPHFKIGMTRKVTQHSHLFTHIFEGYCQCLPYLVLVTFCWDAIMNVLRRWGLPISLSKQPIIQLLAQSQLSSFDMFIVGICVVLLAPWCEEVFFRGILLRFLHAHMRLKKSLWICSLLFAAVHQHFASFLPLCFLGYWLGHCYIKTKCIWTNIGIHALFNGTNLFLISSTFKL
jgi:membrane protease YdiL (CAAX protease family)